MICPFGVRSGVAGTDFVRYPASSSKLRLNT